MTDHTALDLAIIAVAVLCVGSFVWAWNRKRKPPVCEAEGPAGRCELLDGHAGRHRANHEGAIYWWDGDGMSAWSRVGMHYQVPDPDMHDPDPAEMRPRVIPHSEDEEIWQ